MILYLVDSSSLAEMLRIDAAECIEMELDDLQLLSIRKTGREEGIG